MSLSSFLSRVFQWMKGAEQEPSASSSATVGRRLRGLRGERVFLVFIDSSDEAKAAVNYVASCICRNKGRILLLSVITEQKAGEWIFVESLIEEDAERQAEEQLRQAAKDVYDISGAISQLILRKGDIQTEILSVLEENPDITVLVTAASPGENKASHLVRAINNPRNTYLPVPVTIIPSFLVAEENGTSSL